jgi:hypothetical protein
LLQKVCDPPGEYSGLSGSSAGDDQEWGSLMDHSLTLLRVEIFEDIRGHRPRV